MAKCLDISGAAPLCTSCTAGASTTKGTTLLAGDSCQDSTRVRRKPFWQGVGTRAIHCYDMWYMFILQKLRLQLDGRALHFDSCDHQDDMISSSFESLIESKQSVPPVSILELLRVFENGLTSRAVWLARK